MVPSSTVTPARSSPVSLLTIVTSTPVLARRPGPALRPAASRRRRCASAGSMSAPSAPKQNSKIAAVFMIVFTNPVQRGATLDGPGRRLGRAGCLRDAHELRVAPGAKLTWSSCRCLCPARSVRPSSCRPSTPGLDSRAESRPGADGGGGRRRAAHRRPRRDRRAAGDDAVRDGAPATIGPSATAAGFDSKTNLRRSAAPAAARPVATCRPPAPRPTSRAGCRARWERSMSCGSPSASMKCRRRAAEAATPRGSAVFHIVVRRLRRGPHARDSVRPHDGAALPNAFRTYERDRRNATRRRSARTES